MSKEFDDFIFMNKSIRASASVAQAELREDLSMAESVYAQTKGQANRHHDEVVKPAGRSRTATIAFDHRTQIEGSERALASGDGLLHRLRPKG